MKKILITILAITCSLIGFSQKRVEIIPEVIEALPGSEVLVPVVVTGFNTDTSSVAAIEFYIEFDKTVLTYIEPVNFSEQLPSDQWFYSNSSDTLSRFACNWAEPGLANVSIPDGTVLFDIRFLYNGGESSLEFDEELNVFVHIDENFNLVELQVDYFDGIIKSEESETETTWNGTGIWSDGNFWSNGLPTPASTATIETGEVTIQSGQVSCKILYVNAGAVIKIQPNKALTVDSFLTNNGMIWLLSDQDGTGSLIVHKLTEGSGNYKAERYLAALSAHTIGAPMAGTNSNIFPGATLSEWNEPTASFIDVASGSAIESGKGYLVHVPSNGIYTFESTALHQGDISLNLSNSFTGTPELSGLNLISNPYPSAVEWNNNWTLSNVGKAIYIWKGYKYLVWNGYIGNITNGIIPEMQGFVVKATGSSPSITIPNNARLHSDLPFYKETEEIENLMMIEFGELIEGEQGPVQDLVFFHIDADATQGFDALHDAYKIPNSEGSTMAYSILNGDMGQKMAIDVRNQIGNAIPSIPLGFRPAETGTYYLRLYGVPSFSDDLPITLADLQPGQEGEIDMRNDVNNFSYIFSASPGDNEARFVLHFSPVNIAELSRKIDITMQFENQNLKIYNNDPDIHDLNVMVFDVKGSLLFQTNTHIISETSIHISNLSGMLIVKLTTEKGMKSQKFIR